MSPDVDPAPIPEELKQRDQWLLWGSDDPDAPKQPHWRGNFSISWSNPSDWHSFEEAYEAAQEKDSWGIGYVFANDNDSHPDGRYTCIDLDGCLEERGSPKDWLPSLQAFVDAGAYMEYSPSGTGIHIPLADFEPPAWWTDCHFTDDEHEGVDLLANKFCTFTGRPVDVAGSSVDVDQDLVEEFLAEASEVVTGEDPLAKDTSSISSFSSSSTRDYDDEDRLDEDAVEEALSHINADVGYPTWRNIGFALQDHFGDRTALRLFIDWSRRGHKWSSDAEQQAERIIRDASSGGGCTIGTVVHLAKKGGWEPPSASGWRDRDFSEAVRDETEDVDGLSDADEWEIWSDERLHGRLDENSIIPEGALRHLAVENGLYDFDALEDADELPPKAHNRALWRVENIWAEEHLGEDAQATARPYKDKDAAIQTWEDVRYVYDESKEDGRYAAVRLLRRNHDFLTPEDTEVLHIYREDLGIFEEGARYDVGLVLDRELESHYSSHEKNEIIARLKERTAERDDLEAAEFDANLVCVENGVLDLDERELLEHDPKYLFTTHLPVEYDESAEASRIKEFLYDITRREEDALTLLELVGNCLLPNYEHEKILFLFGEGANGKSTWLNVVREFLGADNTTSLQLQKLSENRFATARLVGKWANIAEDLPAKKLQDTGTLKDLSGGGEVAAEKKGQDGFDFHNRAKLMFAANRPPVLGERTFAIQRRLAPIHLPNKYTEDPDDGHKDREKGLAEDLTTDEELSGLLNAALDGLERLEENGDISMPETPEERLELYEKHSDHVKSFRVDCLRNEGGSRVTKDDVYNAYTNFCKERDREPLTKQSFWRTLRKTTLNVTERRLPEDAEGNRPRALDNVAFTDAGLTYAPGVETQSADDEDEESSGTPRNEAVTSLADLSVADGYSTITVEVVTHVNQESESSSLVAEGTLRDGTDMVDYVDFEGVPVLDELEEGECYRISNVKLEVSDKYGPQLKFHGSATEIEPIQKGVGYTGTADPGESAQIDEAATDGGASTATVPEDAEGSSANVNRLVEILESDGEMEKHKLLSKAGQRFDLSPETAESALETAKQRGDIMVGPDGGLKSGR